MLVDELCLTQSLRDVQTQNELSWRANRTLKDSKVSMIIWGGAGMLARSHVFQVPYIGHPLRQRLIKETALITPRINATDKVLEIIQTERTKLFQQFGSSQVRTYANFNLPPIAIEVINEARTADELITVAIQLREKYSKLRKWLATYETAYANEDTKGLIKHQKKLHSVAKSINELLVPKSGGTMNLSIGVSWLRWSLSGNPLDELRNRFGVRAAISKLILASQGQVALKKLLSFFEEESSALGRDTYNALATRE